MDKRKAIIGGCVVLLLSVTAAWAFGLFGGTDPDIAKLQDLGEQMTQANLPQAQQDQLRSQFREQMGTLTDDQRRTFFDANRDQWESRSQEQMNAFFAMSKADQQKRLDEMITRMSQPRDNQRSGAGNRTPNGGGRASMTEAQREERSKRRLDRSTPKTRAQLAEFRKMLDQRAWERGVTLQNNWGRGV